MVQKRSIRKVTLVTVIWMLVPFIMAGIDKCVESDSVIFNCSGVGLATIPSEKELPYTCQTLDLSKNHITNISRLDFSSSYSIQDLLLSNNQIYRIEKNAFEQMTHLIKLDLSGNNLEGHTIGEWQFYELNRLKLLNMEGNPLHVIRKGTFSYMELQLLLHLDLSHCDINDIEEDAIALPDLEYLDLSWNNLVTFNKLSYHMLNDLKTLDLSHNQITVLDQIPYLPRISVLNFDNNRINNVSVKDDIWVVADSLQHLYVRNNDIMRFSADSFPWDLETLEGIYLDNNPIHCDCRMKWFVRDEDLQGRNFTIPCAFPNKHKGKNLLTIPPEELKCGTRLYKILILVALSLVVVLCFMMLVYFIAKRKKKNKKIPIKQVKKANGANYTAVYTKDDDDVQVHISDEQKLLNESGTEFDV